MPSNQLDPKIKSVWRISSFAWLTVIFVLVVAASVKGVMPLAMEFIPEPTLLLVILFFAIVIIYALLVIVFVVVLPPIRFARWRYELTDDYLEIALGIFLRKRFIIPFIRVQDTNTKQGPIMRYFGLSSVTVATAAGEHEIPGLDAEEAEQLRDRAAELARIAQEDV